MRSRNLTEQPSYYACASMVTDIELCLKYKDYQDVIMIIGNKNYHNKFPLTGILNKRLVDALNLNKHDIIKQILICISKQHDNPRIIDRVGNAIETMRSIGIDWDEFNIITRSLSEL
jgi:hypothetical protein